LEAARTGTSPNPHTHSAIHQPVQEYKSPVKETVHKQPVKKWTPQPLSEVTVEHVPQKHVNYGEIDRGSQIVSQKNDADEEEALKKEEERMLKKLSRTAPAGGVQTGGLTPALQQPHWNPQAPKQNVTHNQPHWNPQAPKQNVTHHQPVSYASHSTPSYSNSSSNSSDICSCGAYPQGKFCQSCGGRIIQKSSYGEIDTRSAVAPRNDSDEAEALRREEERMTKKIGNTGAPTNAYSVPVHNPHQASPKPNRFQITETVQEEDFVEEIILPVRNMGVSNGPGTFCFYEILGNPQYGLEDRPRIAVDQTDTYLFTPTPGKLDFSVECLVEGSDLIKFKLTTANGALYIQKYSMPFSFGREKLKRIGNSIQLDPF